MTAVEHFKAAQSKLLQRYGINAESMFVDVPAVQGRVHVLRTGTGPPVVMVPGFADPAAMWTPLIAELDGVTVYAVDRPCFGLTGTTQHATATFRQLATDFLEQVLDALGLGRPLIVGNSIGATWSTWFALDRPDRVAAMVHVGCPAFWLGTSAPLPLRLVSVSPIGRFIMALSPPSPRQIETFASKVAGEDLSRLPELRDLLVAAQKLPGAQNAIRALLGAVVRLGGARPEVSVPAAELAKIRQPVLMVWGADDAFGGPEVGEQAARIIPDCELGVVPAAGHVPWVGHPAEVAALTNPFLRNHAID